MQADYKGVEVTWRGLEIHPEVPPEGLHWPPHLRAGFGGMSDWLREQAQQAGLALVIPEVIPNSRRALKASEYAREQGKHQAFHEVVFRKFYGQGQDLSSWDMLRSAAAEVGLDGQEMQHKTDDGQYTAIINGHRAELAALGATGVPLFIFNGQYAVIGLQPYEAFQEVMEHLAQTG